MSLAVQAIATHARDVMTAASRRRTLWFYLIVSTVLVGALVLGADVSVELRRVEPLPAGSAFPRTVALDSRVLPGSVRVEAGDLLAPGAIRLHDDGEGKLGDGTPGTIDYAVGLVTVVGSADVAPVASELTIKYAVSLVGLDGPAHARAIAEGTATRLAIFGQDVEDRVLPVAYAAPYLLLVLVFNGILIKVLASFFGVLLGLLSTNDAVSSAFEPGAVEMHLSRPTSRGEVVLGRFLGALGFGLTQLGWLLGLAVVLTGLKFGVWVPSAMLLALPMLLKFAVLLAVVTLVTVWLRTAALGLSAGALVWVISFACYFMQGRAAKGDVDDWPPAAIAWLDRLAYAVPPVAHLDDVASAVVEIPITDGPQTSMWVVLVLGGLWVVAPLGLTVGIVSRRDY